MLKESYKIHAYFYFREIFLDEYVFVLIEISVDFRIFNIFSTEKS